MLRGLPQLTISPTHNSSPNDLTLATSLSRHTCRLRALSSPRSPSLIGWGVAGAPPRITIHRFVRGAWLEPRPRGLGVSSCGWSRSSKPLAASPHFARLASPRSPRLARFASLALDSPRSTRLARPHLGFLLDSPCLARLAYYGTVVGSGVCTRSLERHTACARLPSSR